MSDIAIAFRKDMIARSTLALVLGTGVHVDELPQNVVFPCVRIEVVSDYPKATNSGTGLGRATLQLNVIDNDRVTAGNVAELIRTTYDGYTGMIGEFKTRVLARNLTSDWIENAKLFVRMVEVDVGYVR